MKTKSILIVSSSLARRLKVTKILNLFLSLAPPPPPSDVMKVATMRECCPAFTHLPPPSPRATYPSAQLVTEMDHLKDKLFDISACSFDLPIVACDHNRVHCRQANCVEDHFICECAPDKRVPREDYGEEEGRMVERHFRS